MSWLAGKSRLVYNLPGVPRVVIALKGPKSREFVFSTGNPEEVMRLIRWRTGKAG